MKAVIKKLLPNKVTCGIKVFILNMEVFFSKIASIHNITSTIFYIVNGQFSNEHQAVLKGKVQYYTSLRNIGNSCALLRRNIHRLEKGLIMKPRKKVFAENFIEETVSCYKDAITEGKLNEGEKKWATDVLDEYFKIAGETEIILKAKAMYESVRASLEFEPVQTAIVPAVDSCYKPYEYGRLQKSEITFDAIKGLFIHRRSVRWYKNQHVPKELVQKAANIASLAPSACNRQPYRFMFCNNKDKAVSIAQCAGGTTGFAENIPAIIAIVGDLSAYPFEKDRHLIYIDGSLAAMQLMLALETLGLSSCSINWPDVNSSERKIRRIIKLKGHERIIMLMAVGYADMNGGIPFSQKKMNEQILEDISA